MIFIALLLLAAAAALIVAAIVGESADVTVTAFNASIATNTTQVFVAGVITGVVALLALVLLRVALRRSRARREEVRELRRRARAAPAPSDDDAISRPYSSADDVDNGTVTERTEYPNE